MTGSRVRLEAQRIGWSSHALTFDPRHESQSLTSRPEPSLAQFLLSRVSRCMSIYAMQYRNEQLRAMLSVSGASYSSSVGILGVSRVPCQSAAGRALSRSAGVVCTRGSISTWDNVQRSTDWNQRSSCHLNREHRHHRQCRCRRKRHCLQWLLCQHQSSLSENPLLLQRCWS